MMTNKTRLATNIEYECAKIHLFISRLGWWAASIIVITCLIFLILILNEANAAYFSLTLIKAAFSLSIFFIVFINIKSFLYAKPSRHVISVSGILKHHKTTDALDASGTLWEHRRFLYFIEHTFRSYWIGDALVKFPLYSWWLYEPLIGEQVSAEIVPYEYQGEITTNAFVVTLNPVMSIHLSYKKHGNFYKTYVKYALGFTFATFMLAMLVFAVALHFISGVLGLLAIIISVLPISGTSSFLANYFLKKKYNASHNELLSDYRDTDILSEVSTSRHTP